MLAGQGAFLSWFRTVLGLRCWEQVRTFSDFEGLSVMIYFYVGIFGEVWGRTWSGDAGYGMKSVANHYCWK